MIKEINCNLLEAPVDGCFQCCNAFLSQNSGVALALKTKWPEVYEADLQTQKGDWDKMGKISIAKIKNPDKIKYVFNLYGQYEFGTHKRQLDYEYFYQGLLNVVGAAYSLGLKSIGCPYQIGCCRAGGNWGTVRAMLEDIFGKADIYLWICRHEN